MSNAHALSAPSMRLIFSVLIAASLAVSGCGDDGESSPSTPTSNERFDFEEGSPGTSVGAHVVVDVDGEEYYSAQIETLLESSSRLGTTEPAMTPEEFESRRQSLRIDAPAEISLAGPEPPPTTAAIDTVFTDRDFLSFNPRQDSDDPEFVRAQFNAAMADLEASTLTSSPMDMLKSSERIDGCTDGPHIASTVDRMGTFDGWLCELTTTGNVETASLTENYNWHLYIAPEGLYFGLSRGKSLDLPYTGPSMSAGWSNSMTCYMSPDPNGISVDYLDSLSSISVGFSFNMGSFLFAGLGLSVGYTTVLDGFDAVGFGVGHGWSVSFNFLPVLDLWPISVGVPLESERTAGPLAVASWGQRCLDPPYVSDQGPFDEIASQTQQDDTPDFFNQPPPSNNGDNGPGSNNGDNGPGSNNSDDGSGSNNSDDGSGSNNSDNGGGGIPIDCDDLEPGDEGYEDCEDDDLDSSSSGLVIDDPADHRLQGSAPTSALTGSFFQWMGQRSGVGTAHHIPAGSQGDWFGEYIDRRSMGPCSDCSNMSINAIADDVGRSIRQAVNQDDNDIVSRMGLRGSQQYLRSAPEFGIQNTLMEGMEAAVQASYNDLLAFGASMQDDPHRHHSPYTREYAVRAGDTVAMPVEPTEITDLIGGSTADIAGATVCLSTFRTDDEVCGQIGPDEPLTFNYTPDNPRPRIFTINVDLSTADGYDAADVEDWVVRPARRMVTPLVDTPAQAGLTSAPVTVSGSPVTLNAQLLDENGRFVQRPATFHFYDPHGELLATVDSSDGRATHQYIPRPVAPSIATFETVDIDYNGGDQSGLGYLIQGQRISQGAQIFVDGQRLSRDDFIIQHESPEAIIIAPHQPTDEPIFADGAELRLVNPGDLDDRLANALDG